MLCSLPTLHPPSPHTLWYPTLSAPADSQPNPTTTHTDPHHPHHRPTSTPPLHHQTHLTALHADEAAIHHRKAHIRRFGAAWLRPPGVSKTLQGLADERAEREEGEMVRAREAAMAEAQAAAEEEAAAAEGLQGPDVGLERDLDEEVPDAEADGDGWSDAGEEAFEEGEGLEGAEQSLFEEEPDLDLDVPEGGSYEHTDTEVEDESSEDGDGRGVFADARGGGGLLGRSVFGSGGGRRSSGREREN